ncbi:MAG TPA: hypothetical protein VLA09_10905 [Longimicrobiales bacterium]|nr:hypothetical protein [Longimicrobiales bacterium]
MDELYLRMTPAEKLDRVRALTLLANRLALAGLRARHPDEPEAGLMMRLARIRLGADLFERAYPGVPESDDG